jgi:predicted transcriptional regulator
MMNIEEISHNEQALTITAQIASAYLHNNTVPLNDVSKVLQSIYDTVSGLGKRSAPAIETKPPVPAVPIKKSVADEYLVCLEDGRKLKTLKRHLRASYNMTPEEYRAKWNLPPDYPMVAPNYAQQRSALAKALGLGTDRTRRAA